MNPEEVTISDGRIKSEIRISKYETNPISNVQNKNKKDDGIFQINIDGFVKSLNFDFYAL